MANHGTTSRRAADQRVEALDQLWSHHHADWRDASQIVSQWHAAHGVDPSLLRHRVTGDWWELLESLGITLIVSREYEHLLMGLSAGAGEPLVSYMAMPHPSGIAVDRSTSTLHVASTRNPNQIYDLRPVQDLVCRDDQDANAAHGVSVCPTEPKPLVPVRSTFFPGCLYMHDLAFIGGDLYANAVGQNAVVKIDADGEHKQVWWPKAIESEDGPAFGLNYLQLNSIAAGATMRDSYFSASTDRISSRRPGHKNFAVDGRGVIFSGRTREPVLRGLTRPHSARLHNSRLYVDNSGYGELAVAELRSIATKNDAYEIVRRLPGWTRGLCFYKNIAFVGTSRVIPKFAQYAPGLNAGSSQCGVHAVNVRTGEILGSIIWPSGNQLFAIEWLPADVSLGFPFKPARHRRDEQRLFYGFKA